jgi:hypothetical protein
VFREESGAVGLSGRDLPAAHALSGHANVLARARHYEASGAFVGETSSTLEALAYIHLLNGVSAQDAVAFARTATAEPPVGAEQDGPGSRADDQGPGNGGDTGSPGDDEGPGGDDEGPGGGSGPGGIDGDGPAGAECEPVLPEVTAPLATLQGRAERPGDNRLLGALDPALVRDLAGAAARHPVSRWEVTIVDDQGYAVGHGVARPERSRRQTPQPPQPPGPAFSELPARVNITVTEVLLRQLTAQPRSGDPPDAWDFVPRETGGEYGTWTLTLPGGRGFTVRFDVVPTHACDHAHQVSSYQPSDRLRRLVQVRDHECTFPPCSRSARESDFEHALPYDQGGRTCGCNAGARSRRCHQVKQMPGWNVTQPRPGWHEWTTPTGRTYVQAPWRYIA